MQTLRVGAASITTTALADDGGLDIDLMTAVTDALNLDVEFIPYEGADFMRLRRARLR